MCIYMYHAPPSILYHPSAITHPYNYVTFLITSSPPLMCIHIASFPGPRAAFGCMKESGGPGMFPHVRDVEGRKVVEGT